MSNRLNVSLVQTNLIWENPQANRANIETKIKSIPHTDLIILPEMFTSGFSMNVGKVEETMQGKTIQWLKEIANQKQTALCGSLVITNTNNYYNRFVFVTPSGSVHSYDKCHTFALAGENEVFTAGNKKVVFDYKGWKICPQVCYDLRFPVWTRNTEDYDLLIFVANWPKSRINAWNILLPARAVENMAYCIGVNRVGVDNKGNIYPGYSAAYDVLGRPLSNIPACEEAIETVTLNKNVIAKYRKKLNFLNDRDHFTF